MSRIYIFSPSSAVRDRAAFRRGLARLRALGQRAWIAPVARRVLCVSRDVADGELRLVRAEQLVKPGWADRFHDAMKKKKAEAKKG